MKTLLLALFSALLPSMISMSSQAGDRMVYIRAAVVETDVGRDKRFDFLDRVPGGRAGVVSTIDPVVVSSFNNYVQTLDEQGFWVLSRPLVK